MNYPQKFLTRNLHEALQNDFWTQFLEVIGNLVNDYKAEEVTPTIDKNNIEVMTIQELIDYAEMFGYSPVRNVDGSKSFLLQDVKLIPQRVKYKGIKKGYDLIFKTIEHLGSIYRIMFNGSKLYRALDWSTISDALGSYTISQPFLSVTPDLKTEKYLSYNVSLDRGLSIDTSWRLDETGVYINTKHLGVEYIIDRLADSKLISNEYLVYCSDLVEYNRKNTEYPHVGCTLGLSTSESGSISIIDDLAVYSIPTLQIKNSVTPFYKSLFFIEETKILDDSYTLDEALQWTLDEGAGASTILNILDEVTYLVAGHGSLGLYNNTVLNIYEDNLLYFAFREEQGTLTYDSSANAYEGAITGDTLRGNSILGRSLLFRGNTRVYTPSVITSTEDKTYQLWIGNAELENGQVLFDLDFLKVEYDSNLKITLTGASSSASYTLPIDSSEHLLQIEIDEGNSLLNVFKNATLNSSHDVSALGDFVGTYDLYIGGDTTGNYWNGDIADFAFFEKIFSQEEKDYIYAHKLGDLSHLSKVQYRTDISNQEKFEDSLFYYFQSYIKGNTFTETLTVIDSSAPSISGNLQYNNVKATSLVIQYGVTESIIVRDNGFGVLESEKAYGSINYETGGYTLNFFRDYDHVKSHSTESLSSYAGYLDQVNILANTFSLQFSLAGSTYIVEDNGAGNIVGTGISSGTIDYPTGYISVTFSSPTVEGANILSTCVYRKSYYPSIGETISSQYVSQEDYDITEVGLEDKDHNLMYYATFPPVNLGAQEFHFAPLIIIRKT